MIAYTQSTGSLYGSDRATLFIAFVAWLLAAFGLTRNMRAVKRARLLGVADEH
jgi:hypothetical protein